MPHALQRSCPPIRTDWSCSGAHLRSAESSVKPRVRYALDIDPNQTDARELLLTIERVAESPPVRAQSAPRCEQLVVDIGVRRQRVGRDMRDPSFSARDSKQAALHPDGGRTPRDPVRRY